MTRFAVLPTYLVRVAGFSFQRLDALRCARSVTAAQAVEEAIEHRASAGRRLEASLEAWRPPTGPSGERTPEAKRLTKCIREVRAFARDASGGIPPRDLLAEAARAAPDSASLIGQVVDAHEVWTTATRRYAEVFASELEAARVAIRRMYADARMQEAVFIESPEAYIGIRQLVANDERRDARSRMRERLAVMYAQRFCGKNDTNSICGPIGLSALEPGIAGGPARIDVLAEDVNRQTYVSHWAAQRLLDVAVERAGGDDKVTYRLHPTAHIDGASVSWCVMEHDATTSFRRRYARSQLPPAGLALLGELAEPVTAHELIPRAAAFDLDADDVTSFLGELADAGLVVRGPLIPPGLFLPLRWVAAEIERWAPSEVRTWALDEVSVMEDLVGRFARAPLAERVGLFDELVARFGAATGDSASRAQGRHYADRSIIHEDCFAETRTALGAARDTLDRTMPVLVAALELPAELARERVREWFRARFGSGARVPAIEAHRAYDEDRVLDTAAATPRAQALRDAMESIRHAIATAVEGARDGVATITTAALQGALDTVTAPTHPAYVSADIMLRQRPGHPAELVMGEVHGFFWFPTCLLDVMPAGRREEVVEQMREAVREMAAGQTTAECLFLHTQATDRRFALASTDLQLMVPSDRAGSIDLGALDITLSGDEFQFFRGADEVVPLVAYTNYPFIQYTSRISPLFDDFAERFFPDSLLPASVRDHDAPRLRLDDVIVRRRLWRRPVAMLRAALTAPDEATLFRLAQRLRRDLGCEDRVFVSVPGEPKPVLLDFHNMFLLETFVKMLHDKPDDAVVKISEMMPGPDELAAHAHDGARTSELRIGFYRT